MNRSPDRLPRTQPPGNENLHTSAEGYHEAAQRLRKLIDFMTAGGKWEALSQSEADGHRATLKALDQSIAHDPECAGLSKAQAAVALIARFERKANAAGTVEANQPKATRELETVRVSERAPVPFQSRELYSQVRLSDGSDWEIVSSDPRNRTYILADPTDRRAVSDIKSDVRSGRRYNGRVAGYEMTWQELEDRMADLAA